MTGQLLINEPLARYTSWRVGGTAEKLYNPTSIADLSEFLREQAPEEAITWLGLGSNVLIRDQGISGTVIHTLGGLMEMAQVETYVVRAEAGLSCAKLARYAAKAGLGGGEFFAGIPGTVGGALRMNAGAFGGETWQHVVQVETIDRWGKVKIRQPSDYEVSYRSVLVPEDEWFVAGYFAFESGDKEQGLAKIRELLDKRAATQPTGEHSCGSVFRNPKGDYAARLIEATGLKGLQLGGAFVSKKHANFIINSGTALASEIELLIQRVQGEVAAKFGVSLVPEVHIIGI